MDSYQNFNFSNSIFLAERLKFIQDCEKSRCILAECYLQNQKYHQAYEVLKDLKGNRAKFLFAKACYHMNNLNEAENVLLNHDRLTQQKVFSKKALENVVNNSQGLFLLGQIKEKLQKFQDAADCYIKAFKKNPLLFTALENLLKLMPKIESQNMDKILSILQDKNSLDIQNIDLQHSIFKSFNDFAKAQKENTAFQDFSQKKNIQESKKSKNILKKTQTFSIKVQELQKFSKKKSPSKKKTQKSSSNRNFPISNKTTIYSILETLAKPLVLFHKAQHKQSLDHFKKLPQMLKNDSWVYLNIGKCYTEFSDHKNAEIYFKKSFDLDPAQIKGSEYYSSCLWHLKKLVDLTKLAYSCLQKHYFEPETWITLANCYSLNQDHDMALKFLQRAIQIDPNNAYAHCMTGHEFSSKENYEQASQYYKKAISFDKRNVRAYWGLGNLNLKTERYKKAINYFTRAIEFNNDTPTVYTQLAIAHLNLSEYQEALQAIKLAEKLAPKDAFNRYHKAQILFKLNHLNEAELVCKELLRDYQKEPQIYILLAQILQQSNKKSEAHQALLQAQTLDQRNQQKIKQMIEALNPS